MPVVKKQLKEVVRLQFDVRRAQLTVIDSLVEICGLSSKKELFNNSLALINWAVQETRKGRRIASYNEKTDEIELVALPALNFVPEDMSDTKSEKVATASMNKKSENRVVETSKPQLGVVGT